MHPEVDELRPKLKEILYDCAVEIRATKAALYLYDGESVFELVTEYGFRGGVRETADFNDPVVDRCGRGRTPFFVNGVGTEPRFSELLFHTSTDRLLAVPLYSRGKLIGFVDTRDKAAKAPFSEADLPKAQTIADRLVDVLSGRSIFGHRFITLSEMSGAAAPAAEAPAATAASQPRHAARAVVSPEPPAAPKVEPLAELTRLVLDARTAAARIAAAPEADAFGEEQLVAAREGLQSILLVPGTVAAMFSAMGHAGGVLEIAARSTLTEEARDLLQSKLNVWLSKRGDTHGFAHVSVQTPPGTSAPAIRAADVQKVFTAPLTVNSLRGLYLTVAFGALPDRAAHELLAVLHAHVQLLIERSMGAGKLGAMQIRIAEKLVEPDFTSYRALGNHSIAVMALTDRFARYLGMTEADAESARIVALVHDVGMRLLDYEHLYRKHDLQQDELALLREHVAVGAAMVEPLLGREIAHAVLCHHERVDGRGYPNQLTAGEIPRVSLVVQLCDAWVAMTDGDTYQQPHSHADALAAIARAAGTQFDAELAARFVEMMRS